MKPSKLLIFLTACVNPNGMKYTKLQDKDLRARQYVSAINFYLQHTSYRILMVENSNYDLYSLIVTPKDRFEYLTFDGNNYDRNLGKGYGEAMIIDYASKHSSFFKDADFIVKITGRDIVVNVNALIKEMRDSSYLYANIKSGDGHLICHSRLVGFPKSYLQHIFLKYKEYINDSEMYYFEDLLFETAKGHIREFLHPILTVGVSGSTGEKLSPSFSMYFKAFIKYYLHLHNIFRVNSVAFHNTDKDSIGSSNVNIYMHPTFNINKLWTNLNLECPQNLNSNISTTPPELIAKNTKPQVNNEEALRN